MSTEGFGYAAPVWVLMKAQVTVSALIRSLSFTT